MTTRAARPPAPRRRPGRRGLIAVAVLLGLFLMHGMFAGADAACANGPVFPAVSAGATGTAGSAVPATGAHESADSASFGECGCEHSMAVSCVPRTQRDSGALLAALLLALAWGSIPRSAPSAGGRAARRRARRALGAASLLTLTCVCRT